MSGSIHDNTILKSGRHYLFIKATAAEIEPLNLLLRLENCRAKKKMQRSLKKAHKRKDKEKRVFLGAASCTTEMDFQRITRLIISVLKLRCLQKLRIRELFENTL